jgi:predicted O-linked N-acetylglucosamine transferase (SPINDLY family)
MSARLGGNFIDAIIVDPFVVPSDQQPFFTEQLVPVRCWWPATIPRTIGERTPSRKECGLPAGFVFACFNNSYKITPTMFDAWMRLLAAVPNSALWLVEANRLVAANLRREAARRGVLPERLVFAAPVPMDEHLARHRCADLFLDTLPYNACSTAYHALWAGLPVLTCVGAAFAGRMAGTMLHTIGLPELVTTSLAEYERRALQLACEPALLAAVRERLTRMRITSALFDMTRTVRDLEAAFTGLWEARCSNAIRESNA